MKLFIATATALVLSTAAMAETKNFDGCLATKVEGANYFNLVDPRCVTESAKYSSSKGEDKRAEAALAD